MTSYKIEVSYWNGKNMTNCNILIDKGVNGNYISHRLAKNLPTYQLQDTYQYTIFNGDTHEIKEIVETLLL